MNRGALRLLMLRGIGAILRRVPARRSDAVRPAVLLLRPDHLGDVLLTRPAIERIVTALPAARVIVAVGPWGRPALGPRPGHGVWVFPFPGFSRGQASAIRPYLLLLRAAWTLRRHRPFQVAVVLRPDHWWGAWLAALAGIPCRIGYHTPENAPFLTTALPFPRGGHAVEHALALVDQAIGQLGGTAANNRATCSHLHREKDDAPRLGPDAELVAGRESARPGCARYTYAEAPLVPASGPAEAARVRALLAERGIADVPIIVLHPGSGSALKAWPLDRFAAVGKDLAARLGARVVITGSRSEWAGAEALHELLPGSLNLAGALSWVELEALLRLAALIVGVDSGPLHLAAAAGTPSVALFGPADPEQFGPWAKPGRHRVVAADLPCRPCRRLDYCHLERDADGPPPCMRAIDVVSVVAASGELAAVGVE